MTTQSMLEGIRITDMTTVIFGPYCTQSLADMGADVIKVEPAEGDNLRMIGRPARTNGMGPCHMTFNRGKRSVVWDMKSAHGQEAMRRLLAGSDVFIHNIRAEAIGRLGLDYEAVKAIKPDIIYVHCVGFGSGGPYASLQAYDDIIQAASGITSLLPRVDGDPHYRYLPMAIADKVAGLHALYAVQAALIHKLRTGQGQHVEVPMLESITHFLLEEHLYGKTFVPPNGQICYSRQVDPVRQPTRTSDGWISIAPYVDERWVRFFEAVGRPDILQEETLNTPTNRYRNHRLLQARLEEVVATRTTEEWLAVCRKAGVPAMRANDMDELTEDPHLKAVGFFKQRTHPSEGDYLQTQPPVRFSARPGVTPGHAPLLGQHTVEISAELGLTEEAPAPRAAQV